MKHWSIKILLICVMTFLSACGGAETSDTGGIFSTDETKKAGELVVEANEKLKLIKKRFKENEPRYEELKNALKDKNASKVKELSSEFENQIRLGSEEGLAAIEKLRAAKDLNINKEYKEYLLLKISSLEKYVEAFEQRRQAAQILGEGYDPKDVARRDKVIADFKLREENFTDIMEKARSRSGEANDLAKASLKKKN